MRWGMSIALLCAAATVSAFGAPKVKGKKQMKSEKGGYEKVILGGGCFWGMQELLRQIPGVSHTEVGYSGGSTPEPRYEEVKTGTTGHVESVLVEFDPALLPFEKLLDHYFRMHDPTTLNRQGNDRGTQYRSVIFFTTEAQKQDALAKIQAVDASKKWPKPVVTTVEAAKPFYRAEEYHQDYLIKNPGGYTCHYYRD